MSRDMFHGNLDDSEVVVTERAGKIKLTGKLPPRVPVVADARQLCQKLRVRGVIVIALTDDDVSGASYGETRSECAKVGKTLDRIVNGIIDGSIPVWE